MGKGQDNKLDNWLDCVFGSPGSDHWCLHCKFRIGVVSTFVVLFAGLMTLIIDYYLFQGE